MDYISENIKQLRKIKELSQKQVAMEIGMAQGQYSRVEGGKVVPTLQTLSKIAEVFEIKLVELFKNPKEIEVVENFPLLEKMKLLSLLDDDEKDAISKIIDIAISKKKLKDSLNSLLAS